MSPGVPASGAPEAISIVLPAHNEEDNIEAVYRALVRSVAAAGVVAEIVFVDDGSTDRTAERVRALHRSDPSVRLVRLSRNFGHQAALRAGLEAARGSAVITMDCDLQHPPDLLPGMIEQWRSGAFIVQMTRTDTESASWFKRRSSDLYYRFMRAMSDHPVWLGPDFQLLDRRVVDVILGFRESRPFLRGLVAWVGFPVSRIEFAAPRRHAGASSFSVAKMVRLALDGMTAMSTKPLRAATSLGLLISVFCLIYAGFAIAGYLRGVSVPGWTSLIITVLFLGAIQLLSIGILGEYVGRIYEISRNVPSYVASECDSAMENCPVADEAAAERSRR